MSDEIETGEKARPERVRRSLLARIVRFAVRLTIWIVGFFVFVFGGAWLWFESSSSGEVLAEKAETILEEGLQRDVSIGDLVLRPGLPAKLVVKDVRMANAEDGTRDDQITLERIELRLALRSLLRGQVRIGDVVLIKPSFVLEVLPDGDGITTNLPRWRKTTEKETEPPDLDVDSIVIRDGIFELLDHVHDLEVVARAISGRVEPNLANLKNPRGVADVDIASVRFRAATTQFPACRASGHVRFEERVLWVDRFEAEGPAMNVAARGPIRAHRLDLEATVIADLESLREPLRLDVPFRGSLDAKGEISGLYSDVEVAGSFEAPEVQFDVYEVADLRGTFGTIDQGFEVVANEAKLANGTAKARYTVHPRAEEQRNVLEIEHEGVSLESLLGIWNVRDTGLLARGRGALRLAWHDGSPAEGLSGTATLTPDPGRETEAQFGTPLGGVVDYRLENGVLRLESVALANDTLEIDLEGGIGLRESSLDLKVVIASTSFVDVDRLWADLAHSFGQRDWSLLQIVGRGRVTASITGKMDEPIVDLRVNADGFGYAGLALERADGRLVFDGRTRELWFDDVRFEKGQGELLIRDRIGLSGEELTLALEVAIQDWETESILRFLKLDFPVRGLSTGKVAVRGVPSAGSATFSPLDIVVGDGSTIKLSGDVAWTPKEKGLSFDLNVGLTEVPIEMIAGVLDLGTDLPLSGSTTGTVHLEGPLTDVEGAGSVTLRRGALLGEPVDQVAADLVLSRGVFRLRNLDVTMPAGFIRGEAKIDFAQDRFGYVISESEIDIGRLEGYPRVRNVLTGTLIVLSSGAGTLEDPEFLLDVRVKDAVLLEVPVDDPGVALYATLRDGRFAARGSVGEALKLEGSGFFDAASGAIDGDVAVSIAHVANVMKRFEKRTGLTTNGRADFRLGIEGSISPITNLVVDGMIETIDVEVAQHHMRTAEPARVLLRGGLLSVDSFRLLVDDQNFTAGGTVAFETGKVDFGMNGLIGAGLLAVAMPDLRATGDIALSVAITGTFEDPRVDGTAEIRQADFRIVGFPQALRNVRSTLVLSENVIEIDSFAAKLGGGVVSAGGRIEFEGGVPTGVRIKAEGRDVDLRLTQGLSVEGAFELLLQGNPSDRMQLQGDARLTKVLYTKDLEIGAAIVDFIVARRAKVDAVGEEWESKVGLAVRVDTTDAISVRNNVARLTGSAKVDVGGTLANPVLLGRASIDEGGQIRLSSIDYRVVSGSVNFQNPFRSDPYIDLTAEGRYQNEYDITIVVTGTPDALEMAVSSDPPIADLSILNVFGIRSDSAGSVNTASTVSRAGASLIDSSVGSLLGSKLSFADNLRLEGLTGSEPKVSIEKSISDDVRAIVTYTMNDAGDNVEIIEWRATPRFLIQATRDSTKDNTYFINAIDISFSRRFGGHW